MTVGAALLYYVLCLVVIVVTIHGIGLLGTLLFFGLSIPLGCLVCYLIRKPIATPRASR